MQYNVIIIIVIIIVTAINSNLQIIQDNYYYAP